MEYGYRLSGTYFLKLVLSSLGGKTQTPSLDIRRITEEKRRNSDLVLPPERQGDPGLLWTILKKIKTFTQGWGAGAGRFWLLGAGAG